MSKKRKPKASSQDEVLYRSEDGDVVITAKDVELALEEGELRQSGKLDKNVTETNTNLTNE